MVLAEYLALLEALGGGKVARRGNRVGAPFPIPPHLKPALLAALEDGEALEAGGLLHPYRLAAALHALSGAGAVWLTAYEVPGGEGRRVLTQADPAPYLRWAARSLPAPVRVHMLSPDWCWSLDLVLPFEAALELRLEHMTNWAVGPEGRAEWLLQGGWVTPRSVTVALKGEDWQAWEHRNIEAALAWWEASRVRRVKREA